MATVNVTIRVRYDQELGQYSVTLIGNTNVYRGDTVNFTVTGALDAGDGNLTYLSIYGWDANIWTDTNTVPLYGAVSGQTFTKYIRSDSVYDIDYLVTDSTISGIQRNGVSASPHIGIIAPADTTPDPFSLGPDISGLQPSDSFVASLVTISGINAGVSATISTTGGSAYFTVNNGTSQTSATVTNGQKIQVFGVASHLYSTSITVTLTIGGVSDSMVVTTMTTPPTESLIQFVSNPITLNNIKAFFGGTRLPPFNPPNNLTAYYKGGNYVPDISQNTSVPASETIKLSDFSISYTLLYFTKFPKTITKTTSTLGGSTSLEQTWSVGKATDTTADKFAVGYGEGMSGAVEYSYSLVEDTGGNKLTGVTLVVDSGSPGDYNSYNTSVTVASPVVTGNTEARYSGTITINIKSKYSPYPVRTTTCKYFFNFIGP